MVAGAAAAQDAPVQGNQAQAHSATVTLTGTQQWVPSNIEVAQGDRLVLRARGMAINNNIPLNPAGIPPRYNRYSELPLPEAPVIAVIGRIGGGSPFLVGSAYDGPAPASGMLELGLNVLMGQDWFGLMSENWSDGRRPVLFEVTVEHVPQLREPEPQPDPANTLDDAAANVLDSQSNGLDADAGNVAAGNQPDEVRPAGPGAGEEPGGGWLVPLLIGAGGMLALVLAGRLLRNALRPKPLPALSVGVHPSLDREQGGVSGDEIALAGPEVRLRTALEPGGTFFDGSEPAVEREERDG